MGLAVAVFTALLLVIPTLATAVPIDLSERVLYTGPLRFQVEAICLDGDCVGETFVSDTVILGRARVQDAGGGNWEILFEAIDRDRQLGFAANLWPAPVPNEIVTAGVEIPELLLPGFESFAGLADGSVDVRVGVNSDFTDLRLFITSDFAVTEFPGGSEDFNHWAATLDLFGTLRAVGVPEPGVVLLLTAGAGALAFAVRRYRA